MNGGISQNLTRNRQVPAQRGGGCVRALALASQLCRLGGVSDVAYPATSSTHPNHTPSSCGQACTLCANLPVFFPTQLTRRAFAHSDGSRPFILSSVRPLGFLFVQKNEQNKGEAGCGRYAFLHLLQHVAGWWPVATRWANRPLSAVARGRSQPWQLTPTRFWASRRGLRATFCIARNSQTSADRLSFPNRGGPIDRSRPGVTRPAACATQTNRGLPGLNPDNRNTASGLIARCGVLRSTQHKTKDKRCSIRS